ncbi:unnamed protein product, partial [Rotaria magnacalcarata]
EIAVKFVATQNEFRENLKTRFSSPEWFEAIDFSKFVIVGGGEVNPLCQSPFPDSAEQDVNLISVAIDEIEFEAAVTNTINKLHTIALKHLKHQMGVGVGVGVKKLP